MNNIPKCPDCGQPPSIKIQCRGMVWGFAEIRCSTGCPGRRAEFIYISGKEQSAREDLIEKWKELIMRTS